MCMKTLFLVATFFLIHQIKAQDVSHIRQVYKDVNERIAECIVNEEGRCGLYSNDIIINTQGNSWRAVGDYTKTTTFWYNDQPEFSEIEGKPEAVLEKINVKTSSVYNIYEEYLFEDGELIFYFRKYSREEAYEESRFYFENGKLLDFKSKVGEGQVAEMTKDDAEMVMGQGKSLQGFFVESMN